MGIVRSLIFQAGLTRMMTYVGWCRSVRARGAVVVLLGVVGGCEDSEAEPARAAGGRAGSAGAAGRDEPVDIGGGGGRAGTSSGTSASGGRTPGAGGDREDAGSAGAGDDGGRAGTVSGGSTAGTPGKGGGGGTSSVAGAAGEDSAGGEGGNTDEPPAPDVCETLELEGGAFTGSSLQQLAGATRITSALTIQGNVESLEALSCVTEIDGRLTIRDTVGLTTADGLERLVRVVGDVLIQNNADLSDFSQLVSLEEIQGWLYFIENPVLLAADGFSSLKTLGFLDVRSNPMLSSLKAPALTELIGLYYKGNGAALSSAGSFDLSKLEIVRGSIVIQDNESWELGSGLEGLEIVEQNVVIERNAGLTALDELVALRHIGGWMGINANPDLTTADGFTALETFGGTLIVSMNDRLLSFKAPELFALTSLDYSFNSRSAASESSFDLSGVTRILENLWVQSNGTWRLGSGLEKLESVGERVTISGNSELDRLDELLALTEIGNNVSIRENPNLATIDGFANLETVGNVLDVSTNRALVSFKAPQLGSLMALQFLDNGGVASSPGFFDLSGVTHIYGNVVLVGNKTWRLGSGLESLEMVLGDLVVRGNAELPALDRLEALATVGGRIYVEENPALASLFLPALTMVGTGFTVRDNGMLPTCNAVDIAQRLIDGGWFGTSTISDNLDDACTP